ncbi:MAG: DUF5069 domain-containing protein [Vulcanimicrobiaceae bacterium]
MDDKNQPHVVPMVSSAAVGPLGACHLPRMWMKILLHAKGRLPAGYRHGTGGFDERTALDLGFDRDAFITFVETSLPTYLEAEAWVRKHAKHLDAESIRKHNEGIHRNKPPVAAKAQRAFVGLDDESVLDATLLNDLDDWMTLHAQVTTGKLPPLVLSSLNAEMTEILREALDASGASYVTITCDFPGIDPAKPAAEVKRNPAATEDALKGKVDALRSSRCTLEVTNAERRDSAALQAALDRAEAVLDEIGVPSLS